jgi:IS1 family transposase
MPTTNSWPFPPETREVQFDEKWSFVAKKQKNCDPTDPADDHKGDWWDHVAYDAENRLVLAVVPGARSIENAEEVVQEAHGRSGGREDVLLTSDEYPAYETAIEHVYGVPEEPSPPGTPGRPPVVPERQVPAELRYATVHKEREKGRVVAIRTAVVLGTWQAVAGALERSGASRTINTSFVERHHLTDRHHNARKSRKTYRFSKDWRMHEAMTYLTMYSYNFCWAVRTLRERAGEGAYRKRTPAMAAGLTDHVWSLQEWLTRPAIS